MPGDSSSARVGLYVDDKGATKTVTSVKGFLTDLGKEAKKSILTGVGLAGGVAAFQALSSAAHAAADFVKESVAAASELQQATGAVQSVLGEASIDVRRFGLTAADAFGLSRREVSQFGAVLGAQLQGMGMSAREAGSNAVKLQQRAADLAATFGGPVSEAVTAVSALLRGERDPIERYGVSLKEADVQARILALGLDTSTVEAKKQATAIASLDLLFQQTATSAGQFAREEDTLAGQQARLNAEMENAHAQIGQGLLPIWTGLSMVARDIINPVADLSTEMELNALAAEEAAAGGEGLADYWQRVPSTVAPATVAVERHGFSYELMAERLKDGLSAAKTNAKVGLDALVDELVGAQTGWESAWDDYLNIMETDLDKATEIAQLQGMLTGQELANGLNSTDPERRAAAEAMKATIEERLFALRNNVPSIAQQTGTSYANALSATKTQVFNAAHVLRENASAPLTAAQAQSYTWGRNLGINWANGMMTATAHARYAAESLASQAAGRLAPWHSPPQFGPLKDLDTDAQELGALWAQNLGKGIGQNWMPNVALGAAAVGGVSGAPMGAMGAATGAALPPIIIQLDGKELAQSTARWSYLMAPAGPSRLPR